MRKVVAALVAGTMALAACGGDASNRPRPPPAAALAPAKPPGTAPAVPPVDASPLATPSGLLLTARVSHPARAIDLLAPALGSLGSFLRGFDAAALGQLAVGAPVGAVLDLEQPIDVAIVHEPGKADTDVLIAASAQLVDAPMTREAFEQHFTLVPIAGGMLRLRAREPAADGPKPMPCAIAPNDNSASGRLVCAGDESALRVLAPYLARTLARSTSTADLRVELFVDEAVSTFDHDDDSAGADASTMVKLLGRQFLHDVSSLVLESGFDGSEADATLTVRMATGTSPLTRALLSHATPNGPPPEMFERLPQESAAGWYARGPDARDVQPLRTVFASSFRTFMTDAGYAKADADSLATLLGRMFFDGGAWTVGAGHRLDPALAAVEAYVAGGHNDQAIRAKARAALQGWVIAGVDEPPQKWIDGVRTLVTLDNVKTAAKPKQAEDLPRESTKLVLTPMLASLGLPAGTLHVECRATPSAAWLAAQKKSVGHETPALAHTTHVFVVPDGAMTWFAVSENPVLAATQAIATLAIGGRSGQLRARRDLDGLRGETTSAGGFLSIAETAMLKVGGGSDDELRSARGVLEGLTSLTSGGMTPVPISVVSTAKPGGPNEGGTLAVHLRVPASVVTELSGAAGRLF
jgi:hypothetical protein